MQLAVKCARLLFLAWFLKNFNSVMLIIKVLYQ